MKIWILEVNQVASDNGLGIVSSFRAQRVKQKTEYYASKEGAESRRSEIYDGVRRLTGFIEGVEVVVTEAEVKP